MAQTKIAAVLVTPLLLISASARAVMGGCSDGHTVQAVAKTFYELSVADAALLSLNVAEQEKVVRDGAAVVLEGVRTTGRDPAVNLNSCKADMHIRLMPQMVTAIRTNPAVMSAIMSEGSRMTGDGLLVPIRYSAQLTDDKRNVYVEVEGLEGIAKGIGSLLVLNGQVGFASDKAPTQAEAPQQPSKEEMRRAWSRCRITFPSLNWSGEALYEYRLRIDAQGRVSEAVGKSVRGGVDRRASETIQKAIAETAKTCKFPSNPAGSSYEFTTEVSLKFE